MRILPIFVLLLFIGVIQAQQSPDDGGVSPISELINSGEEIPVPPVAVQPVLSGEKEIPETHTIQSGDSPWTIARAYGVSMKELLEINEIKDTKTLQIGQVLKLPLKRIPPIVDKSGEVAASEPVFDPGDYEVYVIKKGDNPWTIARRLKVDEQALIDLNQISEPQNLKIGGKLKIPRPGEVVPSSVPLGGSLETDAPAAPVFDPDGHEIYVIKRGDNPWTIAKRLQIDYKELVELNQIADPKDLKIGQKLKLPTKAAQ